MSQIKNETLADKVADALREQIVSGNIAAGTPLKQEELSLHFGISMGALREAFRTLQSDGLVTILPRRGVTVSTLSASEALEIFEIRTFLELGALELALPKQTKRDIDLATSILEQLEQAENVERWPELNREFHESLYAAADRPKLFSLIRIMNNNVTRYMKLYLDTMQFQKASQAEHRQMLQACKNKDHKLCHKILKSHMQEAGKQLAAYLEMNSD